MLSGEKWELGHAGEQVVRLWLQQNGFFVVRTADIQGGAPMLEGADGSVILPDLLASAGGRSRWVEVKTKTAPAWYDKAKRFQHGLQLRHWEHYLAVEQKTGIEGWLAILELETSMVLLQTFQLLAQHGQRYYGKNMNDRQPHIYFPRDAFLWYPGPRDIPASMMPKPLPPQAPRTLAQAPAPRIRQLGLDLG